MSSMMSQSTEPVPVHTTASLHFSFVQTSMQVKTYLIHSGSQSSWECASRECLNSSSWKVFFLILRIPFSHVGQIQSGALSLPNGSFNVFLSKIIPNSSQMHNSY